MGRVLTIFTRLNSCHLLQEGRLGKEGLRCASLLHVLNGHQRHIFAASSSSLAGGEVHMIAAFLELTLVVCGHF